MDEACLTLKKRPTDMRIPQALQSAIWAKGGRGLEVDPEVEKRDESELRQSKQRVAALQVL